MRQRTRTLIAIAAVSALGLGSSAALMSSASAASTTRSLALSANGKKLTLFDIRTAERLGVAGNVTRLEGDTKLIGIDFRIQNKKYYGVGNQGGIYLINSSTAQLSKVSQLTIALDGTSFGVDFNPAADRLRVISNTGQNLRHDVNPGGATINDTALAYTAGTPAEGLVGAAYTNNDLSPNSATTLFDLDAALDQVALQSPANAGTLVATGKLGLAFDQVAGFDIQSRNVGGVTVSNTGYATLRSTPTGASSLYRIDLLSGKATKVGTFRSDTADIAVPQQ